MKASNQPWIIAVLLLPLGYGSAMAQSKRPGDLAKTPLIASTEAYKASTQELVRLQQEEVDKAVKKLEQLRQLVAEGLVARNELVRAEESIAVMLDKMAIAEKQIADAGKLVAEVRAQELIQAQAKASLALSNVRPTSMLYKGFSNWSLGNLDAVRSFFVGKFGRSLPTSAIGQSATHNQLGWDHRNSVDVSLHPDSAEGKALLGYLQGQGIPFLAFRSAIPGVATGPHIHIGYPSNRLM